jgi:nucleotide-binding universal stress UspA family protein
VKVITWIVEGTWPACVDATRRFAPDDADVVLLHVTGGDVSAAAHGAFAGLLGRARPDRDPGQLLAELGATSAREMLEDAARLLNRPCSAMERRGRVEREVVAAAEGAGLLVVARDGDDARLGPKSLGPASRFVVDHAPCPVLLVWPREAPGTDSIPPPPDGPDGPRARHPHPDSPHPHGPGPLGPHAEAPHMEGPHRRGPDGPDGPERPQTERPRLTGPQTMEP